MEYQKIINLLDNTPNQLSKFKTKTWIEINDESIGVYNANSDIRFRTTMLKSSLYNYSDAYGKNSFDQPINDDTKTCENMRKNATGQGDDYTTAFLLDYPYFEENYKMIAIDLSKQEAFDPDPRAIQQIYFTANIYRSGNTTTFSLLKKQNKLSWTFHREL